MCSVRRHVQRERQFGKWQEAIGVKRVSIFVKVSSHRFDAGAVLTLDPGTKCCDEWLNK